MRLAVLFSCHFICSMGPAWLGQCLEGLCSEKVLFFQDSSGPVVAVVASFGITFEGSIMFAKEKTLQVIQENSIKIEMLPKDLEESEVFYLFKKNKKIKRSYLGENKILCAFGGFGATPQLAFEGLRKNVFEQRLLDEVHEKVVGLGAEREKILLAFEKQLFDSTKKMLNSGESFEQKTRRKKGLLSLPDPY